MRTISFVPEQRAEAADKVSESISRNAAILIGEIGSLFVRVYIEVYLYNRRKRRQTRVGLNVSLFFRADKN